MLTIGSLGVSLRLMGKREVFIGVFVILVILGVTFGVKKGKDSKVTPLDIPSSEETSGFEERFKLSIPDNVEKINLKSETGFEGVGIATRVFENNTFSLMVIADLPQSTGKSYLGWLIKDENTKLPMGVLSYAKGGYILEFKSNINYSDYKKVEVRLNEEVKLSGSF